MKTKEEIQLQHDWEQYKGRLRSHWMNAAKRHPYRRPGMTERDYEKLIDIWYTDTYLSEPMSPGQEYANNH